MISRIVTLGIGILSNYGGPIGNAIGHGIIHHIPPIIHHIIRGLSNETH